MVHGLLLATFTCWWLDKTPFVQVCTTRALTCPEMVEQRPCIKVNENWWRQGCTAKDSIVNLFTVNDQYKSPSTVYYIMCRDAHFLGNLFVGVAPPSFVAIQAGTTLQQLTSSGDALSWQSVCILAVLAVVALLPVAFRAKLREKFDWYQCFTCLSHSNQSLDMAVFVLFVLFLGNNYYSFIACIYQSG